MNHHPSLLHRAFLLAAAALFLGFAARSFAADTELGVPAGSVAIPPGLNKSEVQAAIVAALAGRGWSVQEKKDDRVVGYLKHRSNEATVTLIYDEHKVDLFCVGYEIDKNGARRKPEQPKSWLGNIRSDLTKRMNQATAKK